LVTKLIEAELEKEESLLAKACQSANHDHTLDLARSKTGKLLKTATAINL